jgi:apolipoprotein N-acyltransferase
MCTWYVAAGVLTGLAQLDARLALLAWVGIIVLVRGTGRANGHRQRLRGLLLFAAVYNLIWFQSLWSLLTGYLGQSGWHSVLTLATLIVIGMVLLQGPLLLASLLADRVPVVAWLPAGWAMGEAAMEWLTEYSMGQLLYSQSQVQPVLRTLGRLGWYPTLLLCLFAAASLGMAWARGRVRWGAPGVIVAAAMFAQPPLDSYIAGSFDGLGVIHMADIEHPPAAASLAADLLIWPEGASKRQPSLEEGAQPPGTKRLTDLRGQTRTGHIAGLVARTLRGPMNAAVLTDAAGSPLSVRGKSVLVPLTERPVLWHTPESGAFVPGDRSPIFAAGNRRIIPAICYEAFSRRLVARGRAAGGDMLVILASDRAIMHGRSYLQRSIGAAVLRSVEYGVPVVRASMWGSAAIIAPDGRVLAQSPPGTSGVLRAPEADRTRDRDLQALSLHPG